MSYAVFKQGVVTSNTFRPGHIIADGFTSCTEAMDWADDWACSQALELGPELYAQEYIDDYRESLSIVRWEQ